MSYPTASLGDVAAVKGGLQVTSQRASLPIEVPYLRVANVHRGRLVLDEVKQIRVTQEELIRSKLAPRDLLVVEGHGNKDEIGRVALWAGEIEECVHQNHLIRVRCQTDVLLPRFLEAFLNSPIGRRALLRAANTTSGLHTISTTDVRQVNVPVPTIAEQSRIAAVLDQADYLRENRRISTDLVSSLSKSIFIDMFGDPRPTPVTVGLDLKAHPTGWPWALLTDVARLTTGHTPDRGRSEYWNGRIPWISLTEIRRLDGQVATETELAVSAEGIRHSSAVVHPRGTVCFSRTASIGFVTVMGTEMSTSQDFVNWICGDRLDPIYLMHALLMSRDRLRALSSGSTHKTIYMRVAENFRILLPPIDIQREFAAQIEAARKVKASQLESIGELDSLFASLQHRAFAGQL